MSNLVPGSRAWQRAQRSLVPRPPQRVYFIQAGNTNAPIKIGRAANPRARLDELQTGNPNRLVLVGETPAMPHQIARGAEEFFHEFFGSIRIRREWFKATDELLDAAEDFCASENASYWHDNGGLQGA